MRGQISIEFFLVFGAFAIIFLWLANTQTQIEQTLPSQAIPLQRAVAYSLAASAGEACRSQAALTVETPCLFEANTSYAYRADFNGTLLTVSSDGTGANVTAATACNATGRFLVSACFGENSPFGCLKWVNGSVVASTGACP